MSSLIAKILVAILGVCCVCSQAVAQTAPLSAQLSSAAMRSSAPAQIVWTITNKTSTPQQGVLEMTLHDDLGEVSVVRTDVQTLNIGQNFVRCMLPPLDPNRAALEFQIALKFVGTQRTVTLGDHLVRTPRPRQRGFVIGLAEAVGNSARGVPEHLAGLLEFENLDPNPEDRAEVTVTERLVARQFSTDPLAYCQFDLLVLVHEGFGGLREKQLDAILAWVSAGGSVCVAPRGAVEPYHLTFLNRLSGRPATGERSFGRSPNGELSFPGDWGQPFRLQHVSWGRAAIVQDLQESLAEQGLRLHGMAAFLWKFHAGQQLTCAMTGKWNDAIWQESRTAWLGEAAQIPGSRNAKQATYPLQTGGNLLQALLPAQLRIVPLSLVFLIILAYVLLIGPGDYLFLGLLRARRWTWITFPGVTVATAALCVLLSNFYLGTSDTRRSLVVHDVGDDNQVVRTNRFEVLFPSSPRRLATHVRKALFTPLDHRRFSNQTSWQFQQGYVPPGLVGPPLFSGTVPADFVVEQYVPQWTPQLNRQLQIPGEQSPVSIDWNALATTARKLLNSPAELTTLQLASPVQGGTLELIVYDKGSVLLKSNPAFQFLTLEVNAHQYLRTRGHQVESAGASRNFFRDLSAALPVGLTGLVSQVSPACGPNFDDMAVLDPTDGTQSLMIVGFDKGNELVIYRKLLNGAN